MTMHNDVKSARIAAEKTTNAAPTTANHVQMQRLAALEVKIGELKKLVADINAAGGLTDTAAMAALTSLVSSL